jgi:hypothetical protein
MQRKLIEHDIPLAEVSAGEKSIRTHEDGTLAEIRYIEVKARARSGAVRISSNEVRRSRRDTLFRKTYGENVRNRYSSNRQ